MKPGWQVPYRPGDQIEVFCRMPYGQDNGHERLDLLGDRWLLCPTSSSGTNRPRTGWTERWLPATFIGVSGGFVNFRWDVNLWFDWASGERIDTSDPAALNDSVPMSMVRARSLCWNVRSIPLGTPMRGPIGGAELRIGGVPVAVSFVVFRWGAAKIPVQYDAHSWGRLEGSTVSAKFIKLFFDRGVVPRLGHDYEVLTVFIQHSDEFAGISPEFLASLCHGQHIIALYFLWPIQGQQTYGDKISATAAYVDQGPFFELVARMEAQGVVTRWPHHSQVWRSLASKDWVPTMSLMPKYHVPLTTRVPRSLILTNPQKAGQRAIATLWHLQDEKRADSEQGYPARPTRSDWRPGDGPEQCVVKLGFSYEGVDVKMASGELQVVEALHMLATQSGYTNDCVYVQQRVHRVDLEARCFVVHGKVVEALYTRFARIDAGGYVRDYEKAHTEAEAMREWFFNDQAAWSSAMEQVRALSWRWHCWLLTQAAERTVSVRIDYMLERTAPGQAEVWTGEVGEQGYSMGGIDPAIVFNAVIDSIADEFCQTRQACDGAAAPNGVGPAPGHGPAPKAPRHSPPPEGAKGKDAAASRAESVPASGV